MHRRTSITLLSVGHACVDVYQGSVASLVPLFVAEREYSYATAAGIVLAASLLSSVAQPVFGAVTDRRPMPWLIPVATLVAGGGIALSGVTGSYGLVLLFVAISGIGVAAYHPEAARIARRASDGSHSAMGWFSLGGNLGFAAAPLLVSGVAAAGGLRTTPLLVVPALAGSVLCLPVLRALARRQAAGSGPAPVRGRDDWRSFLTLSLAVAGRSVAFIGLSTFIALYVEQRIGGGAVVGTAALFTLYIGGAFGSVLGGMLVGRWDRVTIVRRSYLVSIAAVAGVVFVPGPAVFAFVALASLGLYVPFSLQITLGQDYLPRRVGTASGVTIGLAVSVGGIAGPIIGWLADATTLQVALAPLILMPALSWVLSSRLAEPVAPELRVPDTATPRET